MSILKYKDPKTGEFKRINPYKAELSFVGKDGIVVNKAANSEMVEISGSGLVQRTTTANRVYTTDKDGLADTAAVAYTPIAYGVAAYDEGGRITTNEPADNLDCTNKKYVADNYVEKVKFTNLEQALYGYILDTTKEAYADLDSAVLKNSVAVGDNVYPIADKTRALVTRIDGKTTKMVQLLDKKLFAKTSTFNGVTFTNNNDGKWIVSGTVNEAVTFYGAINLPHILTKNHVYLLMGTPIGGSGQSYFMRLNVDIDGKNYGWNDLGAGVIFKYGFENLDSANISLYEYKVGEVITNRVYTPQLFDLTAMNREDITTVKQFKAEFPELYPYENGNIYPAKISGVKFTGKNLFNPSTPKYSGVSSFVLNGDEIVVSQTEAQTYISANFRLPNAKFLIGKKISISGKVKTSDNNYGLLRVLWMREGAAVSVAGTDIISNSATGETERNLSASGIVSDPSDDALKLCLLLYSNAEGKLSEAKTYTATYSNIQVEISDASTAYEPYIEPVSVTLPKTYGLHGIGDYKDYLEITKNENNELYTLKKVQVIDKHVFDGTENWGSYPRTDFTNIAYSFNLGANFKSWYKRGNLMNLLENIKTLMADKKGYSHGDASSNIYICLPNIANTAAMKAHVLAMYEAGTPYIFYGAIETPVETVIATNLTYEQVTAIRNNGGLIEVQGNTNKGYARPTIKNTVVYRLTATNTAEG